MNKKSFIMYKDIKVQIDALPNEEAGQLLKAIYEYQVNNQEIELSPITAMVFIFIKQQFERDHEKYEVMVNNSRKNGSKGGRPKADNNLENPLGYKETHPDKNNPTKGDTVNDTDTVNDNVKDNDNKEGNKSPSKIDIDFDIIYSHYPSSGKKGKTPALNKYKEYRRLKSIPDNETLIDHIEASKKTKSWQDGFVPHFSTWMNQRRWEDEIDESEIVLTEEEQKAEIRREIAERRSRNDS